MRIERSRPGLYTVELHAYELAGLLAAARWTIETGSGDLPDQALDDLHKVLASYEAAIAKRSS